MAAITELGWINEQARRYLLESVNGWSHKLGDHSDYYAHVVDGSRMYIKIKPGGKVHRHSDQGQKVHIVLQSDGGVCRVGDEDFRLREGGIYLFDATQEHESFNTGEKDRIHLVLS